MLIFSFFCVLFYTGALADEAACVVVHSRAKAALKAGRLAVVVKKTGCLVVNAAVAAVAVAVDAVDADVAVAVDGDVAAAVVAEHNRVATVPDIKALEKELRQAKAAVKKAGRLVVDAGTDDENGKNVFLPITYCNIRLLCSFFHFFVCFSIQVL